MFEGINIVGRAGNAPPPAGLEREELRLLEWPNLVARFAAARDSRHAMTGLRGAGPGSFDCHAARRLNDLGESKPAVNPDALGICKPRKVMGSDDGNNARIGDRGTE